jgi:hypothetical protein
VPHNDEEDPSRKVRLDPRKVALELPGSGHLDSVMSPLACVPQTRRTLTRLFTQEIRLDRFIKGHDELACRLR